MFNKALTFHNECVKIKNLHYLAHSNNDWLQALFQTHLIANLSYQKYLSEFDEQFINIFCPRFEHHLSWCATTSKTLALHIFTQTGNNKDSNTIYEVVNIILQGNGSQQMFLI